MYRATRKQKWATAAARIWDALQRHAVIDGGGFAALGQIHKQTPTRVDKMDSWFLSETLKYFYLIFDDADGGDLLPLTEWVLTCVEINQCAGCTRQFFTKSFLGDDAAVLVRSSGEEPASPRHRAGVASMAWRTTM